MKERIVITDDVFADFLIKHRDNHEICAASPKVIMDRCAVEQVPETYEELRSLCIEISTKEDHIHIFNDWGTNNEFLMTHSLKFYPDGTICVNGDNEFIIAKNKTVAEMWNIIRALLEVKK